jgi:serine/threonine-protein kinase RsbW
MSDEAADVVRLSLPADNRFLRLARLTATGVATDAGFALEQIEDLRLAIDEACAVLLDDSASGELEITYRFRSDGTVEIEGQVSTTADSVDVHPVAADLLAMTTDEHVFESDSGRARFRLVKQGAGGRVERA